MLNKFIPDPGAPNLNPEDPPPWPNINGPGFGATFILVKGAVLEVGVKPGLEDGGKGGLEVGMNPRLEVIVFTPTLVTGVELPTVLEVKRPLRAEVDWEGLGCTSLDTVALGMLLLLLVSGTDLGGCWPEKVNTGRKLAPDVSVWAPKLGANFKFSGSPLLATADVGKPPLSENREELESLLKLENIEPEESPLPPMLNIAPPAGASGLAEDWRGEVLTDLSTARTLGTEADDKAGIKLDKFAVVMDVKSLSLSDFLSSPLRPSNDPAPVMPLR